MRYRVLNDPPRLKLADGKKVQDYGYVELVYTKGGKKRYIPIIHSLSEVFKGIEVKDDYVFLSTHGERLKSIKRPMATALKRSGIPRATFHDFRASWASWTSEAGVDPFTIQKIGAWADLKTVLRYVHRNKIDLQVAMSRIVGILDSQPEYSNVLEMK